VNGNIYGVYNEYNSGRIIGVVLPFGGLSDTCSFYSKQLLMCRYLEMLGIQMPCGNVGIQDDAMNRGQTWVHITPNPLKDNALIEYSLENDERVTLTLFNLFGQKVEVLINETQSKGKHQVNWSAGAIPPGVYCYYLQKGNQAETGKMILLK